MIHMLRNNIFFQAEDDRGIPVGFEPVSYGDLEVQVIGEIKRHMWLVTKLIITMVSVDITNGLTHGNTQTEASMEPPLLKYPFIAIQAVYIHFYTCLKTRGFELSYKYSPATFVDVISK